MTDDDIAKARAKIAESPTEKEWDCEAYDRGDTTEEDGYESSDYVDGWNDALAACQPWLAGLPAALDEVELLQADCRKWQALGREATAVIDELGAMCDRVATIASEAFGPFPVQGVEANLTAIEHGIAKLERERDGLLKDRAEDIERREDEALRARERE